MQSRQIRLYGFVSGRGPSEKSSLVHYRNLGHAKIPAGQVLPRLPPQCATRLCPKVMIDETMASILLGIHDIASKGAIDFHDADRQGLQVIQR